MDKTTSFDIFLTPADQKPGEPYTEPCADGSVLQFPSHLYENTGNTTIRIRIKRSEGRPRSFRNKSYELPRYLNIAIKPGERIRLPQELEFELLQHHCMQCTTNRAFCRDRSHESSWQVVGGAGGPNLRRLRSDGAEVPMPTHPALAPARIPAGIFGPTRAAAAMADTDTDARLLARARHAKGMSR